MSDAPIDVNAVAGFELEPTPAPGKVPQSTVDELLHARAVAKDYAQAFADACKAQAEKYGIKPAALKRYIAALADDSTDDLREELDDLEGLLS